MKNLIKKPHNKKSPLWGVGGLLLLLFFMPRLANAQAAGTPYPTPKGCTNVATQGNDFWVTFGLQGTTTTQLSAGQLYLALQLINGNSSPVTVTLRFGATAVTNITVPANTSQQVDLSNVPPGTGFLGGDIRGSLYQTSLTANTNSNSLHITCPAVISVIAFNNYNAFSGATILLPTNIWGSDYYNLSLRANINNQDVHMIIANQNNTNVAITNYNATTAIASALLQAGQVYYYPTSAGGDFTGQHITTSKPAAYFVHNSGGNGGNFLFQELMPTPQWGKYFLIPNETQFNATSTPTNNLNNLVRIIAAKNNTHVNFTNAVGSAPSGAANGYVSSGAAGSAVSSITLQAGQWTEVQIAGGQQDSYCTVVSDSAIGVVDLMRPANAGYMLGGNSICRISPVTNLIPTAVIAPFIPPSTFPRGGSSYLGMLGGFMGTTVTPRHYALIVSPTATRDNVIISRNGVSLGTLTAAAAAVPNLTDPNNTTPGGGNNTISAPTQWQSAGTINGVEYSYIRYDFNYLTDRTASYRITAPDFNTGGGLLITQVGLGYIESVTFNSGSGGCLGN